MDCIPWGRREADRLSRDKHWRPHVFSSVILFECRMAWNRQRRPEVPITQQQISIHLRLLNVNYSAIQITIGRVNLWTRQKPPRLLCLWGSYRQKYWNGLPCPPPGDLPNPGIEPSSLTSPACQVGSFITSTTWELCVVSNTSPEKQAQKPLKTPVYTWSLPRGAGEMAEGTVTRAVASSAS